MRTIDEINAELLAMIAAREQVNPGSAIESWVSGAIFTLSWLADVGLTMTPSAGFSLTLEAAPNLRRVGPPSSRKDPALP